MKRQAKKTPPLAQAREQFRLGSAYEKQGDYALARRHLAAALKIDPSIEAPVQSLLARVSWMEGKWIEALAAADRALEVDPSCFLAHVVRSRCCSALGRMPEADASNRSALAISPHVEFHSYLLFEMNYLSATTPEQLYAEGRRWDALYAQPLRSRIRPHPNLPDPDRRLKIGYVSPNLYHHPVLKFLPPVFEHHNRSDFELFVYAVGSNFDEMTEHFRRNVENFIPVQGADKIAQRVRADGIDILVDLAGHTMGPDYLVFALKPAPIQVSWLGSLSTTGMWTMDYFLGDAGMPCPGTEHLFSEIVYRLPRSVCCYRPLVRAPLAPPPCLERGHITFGSFNNPRKITREVVELWSRILLEVPKSRLMLKYHGLDLEEIGGRFRGWLTEAGAPAERVFFSGPSSARAYLDAYADVDIALDPFPYNGGTTSLDALWMGLPVVTLCGRLAVQRIGASLLSAAGLTDLIAATPEQYLKIALSLARALPKSPEMRRNFREALKSSPLMDETGFVRDLEEAYRNMWRAWCQTRS